MTHEYRESTVGHGEAQCLWCHGTNRENAILSPNHCEARPTEQDELSRLKEENERLSVAMKQMHCNACGLRGGNGWIDNGPDSPAQPCINCSTDKAICDEKLERVQRENERLRECVKAALAIRGKAHPQWI